MNTYYSIVIALIFNTLDLLTGIVASVKNKEVKSSKLRDGLFKKVGFMFCYFIGWLVDTQGYRVRFNITNVLPIILLYSCTTELVSIIENICKINPDILPEKLMSIFHIKKDD